MSSDPVGSDAPDDEEEDLRHEAGREHEPEVGRRARQVDDGERERGWRDRAAEHRDRAAGEQQEEAPLSEPSEAESLNRRTTFASSGEGEF